jgi:hypothetical protein
MSIHSHVNAWCWLLKCVWWRWNMFETKQKKVWFWISTRCRGSVYESIPGHNLLVHGNSLYLIEFLSWWTSVHWASVVAHITQYIDTQLRRWLQTLNFAHSPNSNTDCHIRVGMCVLRSLTTNMQHSNLQISSKTWNNIRRQTLQRVSYAKRSF